MSRQKETFHNKMVVAVFFGFFIALAIGLFTYNTITRFSMEKNFDKELLSVSSETEKASFSLREFGYYILMMEKDIQETALVYNEKQPIDYWNLYLGSAEEGKLGYVRVMAKEYAVEYAKRDLLYELECGKNTVTFEEAQVQEMAEKVRAQMADFDEETLAKVGLTPETFYLAAMRVEKCQAYMTQLTAEGYTTEELDLNGQYFEELLSNYQVFTNDKIIEKLSFGNITVN